MTTHSAEVKKHYQPVFEIKEVQMCALRTHVHHINDSPKKY